MSTTDAAVTHRIDGRALAVALGVVPGTVPTPRLPPLAAQVVPGRSPLEASGWETRSDDAPAPTCRRRDESLQPFRAPDR